MPRRAIRFGEETSECWELRRRGRKPRARIEITDELLNLYAPPKSEITLHDWEPGFSARIRSNGTITFSYQLGGSGAFRRAKLGNFPELSVREARAKISRIQSHFKANGGEPVSAYDSFSDAAAKFLWDGEAKWSPSYHEKNRRTFNNRMIPALGDIPIHQLDADKIRAVIVEEDRTENAIRNDIALMRSFLGWCMQGGVLNDNKLRGSYTPKIRAGLRSRERVTRDGTDEALSLLNPRFPVPEPTSTLLALVALTGFQVMQFLSVRLASTSSLDAKFLNYDWGISFPEVRLGPLASKQSAMTGPVPAHLSGRTISATHRKIAAEAAVYAGDSHVPGSRPAKSFAKLVEGEISRLRYNLDDWEQHLRQIQENGRSPIDEVVL